MMEVLFALVLVLGVAAFVGWPLLRPRSWAAEAKDNTSPLAHLYAQRDTLYAAIKELDFDHAVGHIADQDYTGLRERYAQQAIQVIQQIDAQEAAKAEADLEAEIVAARAGRRKTKPRPAAETLDARLEAEIAAVRKKKTAPAGKKSPPVAGYCPRCGAARSVEDAFCRKCGARLPAV